MHPPVESDRGAFSKWKALIKCRNCQNAKELPERLVARFAPKDKEISAINELADMKEKPGESIMSFLDKARGISLKGGVPGQFVGTCLESLAKKIGKPANYV